MQVETEERKTREDADTKTAQTAIALRYERNYHDAPEVVATGRGCVADEILELARKHNVPLRRDPGLAEALADLDLGAQIPPELFKAVAEVLAFVYRLSKK